MMKKRITASLHNKYFSSLPYLRRDLLTSGFKKTLAFLSNYLYYITMLREKVEEILERIREGLKAEGGDIELVDIKDGVVYVKLKGACGTCPMSEMTMKGFVESTIKKEIPEVTSVQAV
jgi:Fe-S cluster biogenesis protein NfuA